MPPRKEPKEQVIYAASKRKAPPFKPQRPSQVPRISTTESENSRAGAARKQTAPMSKKPAVSKVAEISEDEDETPRGDEDWEASSSELDDDPPATRPAKPTVGFRPPAAAKRKAVREPTPMDVSSDDAAASPPPPRPQSATAGLPPGPSQMDHPVIPQPLLIRLLHEHFADKNTKIDKHAIQVLEKYFEVFVRETIARAALQKQEDAAKTGEGEDDGLAAGWLELEDLEKVAAGMMLDF